MNIDIDVGPTVNEAIIETLGTMWGFLPSGATKDAVFKTILGRSSTPLLRDGSGADHAGYRIGRGGMVCNRHTADLEFLFVVGADGEFSYYATDREIIPDERLRAAIARQHYAFPALYFIPDSEFAHYLVPERKIP